MAPIRRWLKFCVLGAVAAGWAAPCPAAERPEGVVASRGDGAVVLRAGDLQLTIAGNGKVESLSSLSDLSGRAGGTEYLAAGGEPLAVVYRGGRMVPAEEGKYAAVTGRWTYRGGTCSAVTRVALEGDVLRLEFAEAGARATCRLRGAAGSVAVELQDVEGEGIDRLEFVRLRLRPLPLLGRWLGVARDDRLAVGLCGGTLQTDIEMRPGEKEVLATAAAEARVGFRGATAVVFGCPASKERVLDAVATIERDFGLPPGATDRRSPLQRLSYLWATNPTPQNIDEFIRYARLGGFRVLLISYTAFARGAGHFEWNKRYPEGMADLERVTRAVRGAGLRLGLHLHYSKASKTDRYVTPVPDARLRVERAFHLSREISADAAEIPVEEDPAGSTLDQDRRLLKLGTELVEYQGYSDRRPFGFHGCRRGALGTAAAAHAAQSEAGLLDVDTWPAFIRFDQNTDIQDEVARRIAELYRRTGPYDMVYFDGAEDVHEPFWYHVAAAQHRVYRLLDPPPAVCESALTMHFSWHMISRSNAYDVVAAPEAMKDFCRLMPCPTAAARELDLSRIQFGWLGRFGKSALGSAGPDVYEYVASRAAAWDCPVALHATLEELRSNPRADDCLAVFRAWEDARLSDRLSAAQREVLKNVGPGDAHAVPCFDQREILSRVLEGRDLTAAQRRILADRREHHLIRHEGGKFEVVEVREVPGLARGAIKVFLFRREAAADVTYALAWAVEGERRVRLAERPAEVMRPFGVAVEGRAAGGEVLLGPRTYLSFPGKTVEEVAEVLRRATVLAE